ncbi:MAG: hypothetical protein AAF242_03020 [Bacteroidota bacterium]
MKYVLAFCFALVKISLLTLITQIGGVVYLLYLPIKRYLHKNYQASWSRLALRWFSFSLLYLLITLFVVPPVASSLGRVPLPWLATKDHPLKAHNILVSPLLNRHYVKPELKAIALEIAQKMRAENSQLTLTYLDANFPFMDGFPLLPHLSHDDGRKLDLAFVYKNQKTGKVKKRGYGPIGYGRCDWPKKGESDYPALCREKGKWLYDGLALLQPQRKNGNIQTDPALNKTLINLLRREQMIHRIYLEPHLEMRWLGKNYDKIRPAGCHAVRHDDHIHIQI